jgi:uncharacterized protein YegP (UPF0339 family)
MHFEVVTKRFANPVHYLARIKGGNGEIIFSSQKYAAKQSAIHACQVVQGHAASSKIYDVTE